jgi:polar amino acid transport system substrate-binding protein
MKSALVKLAIVCAAMMTMAAGASRAETLRVGVAAEPYPPFTYKDATGTWAGWEIDLIKAACEQMKKQCELVEVSWDGIIPSLLSKQIDVIWSSMSITEERKKVIDFTDMYFDTLDVMIGPKDQKFAPTPEGVKGKTIGVQVSTTNEQYVQKYFKDTAKTIKTYQTQDEANSDLAAGRIDAVQADALALSAFLETEQGKRCCALMGYVAEDRDILGFGTGGGVRKEDRVLKAELNAAISALAKSGEIKKITERHGLAGKLAIPE